MEKYPQRLFAIGIDLGGTNIKAAVCSSEGSIHLPILIPSYASKGPAAVIKQIHSAIESLTKRLKKREHLVGIGIGSPGSVDHKRGRVLQPPNFSDWDNVPVAKSVSDRWELHTKVENDANAAALGEAFFGAGKKFDNFIGITIGTGIGSGIIMNRTIVHGDSGFAGELGHTTIAYDGPRCNCGSKGCVEAYVGNNYLIQHTLEDLKQHPSSILFSRVVRKKLELTPKEISRAANQGDVFARQTLFGAGEKLGVALANAANLLDITTFIIGGGVSAAGKPLFEGIEHGVRNYVIKPLRKKITIIPAQLGNDAGMLGAAALWF